MYSQNVFGTIERLVSIEDIENGVCKLTIENGVSEVVLLIL